MIYNRTPNAIELNAILLNDYNKVCGSCTIQVVLFFVFSVTSTFICTFFIYFHWYWKKNISNAFTNINDNFQKKKKSKSQDQHFEIHVLNLWMNWKNYVLIYASLLKIRWEIQIKKDSLIFKLNINDWDILFTKILRIYHWIYLKKYISSLLNL